MKKRLFAPIFSWLILALATIIIVAVDITGISFWEKAIVCVLAFAIASYIMNREKIGRCYFNNKDFDAKRKLLVVIFSLNFAFIAYQYNPTTAYSHPILWITVIILFLAGLIYVRAKLVKATLIKSKFTKIKNSYFWERLLFLFLNILLVLGIVINFGSLYIWLPIIGMAVSIDFLIDETDLTIGKENYYLFFTFIFFCIFGLVSLAYQLMI